MATSDTQANSITEISDDIQTQEPKKYCVILHNDDVTTFDCVISVLQTVFHHSMKKAYDLTEMVHFQGQGVAGVFTLEIAIEKTDEATEHAMLLGYPLKITYEEH